MIYQFIVEGVNPLPKERPRLSTETGKAYTTNKTLAYENEIGLIVRSQLSNIGLDADNFKENLGIIVHFIRQTKHRVDVDNLMKALKDGLEGVIWMNDNLIKGETGYVSYDKNNYGFNLVVMSYQDWLSKMGVEDYTGSVRGYKFKSKE